MNVLPDELRAAIQEAALELSAAADDATARILLFEDELRALRASIPTWLSLAGDEAEPVILAGHWHLGWAKFGDSWCCVTRKTDDPATIRRLRESPLHVRLEALPRLEELARCVLARLRTVAAELRLRAHGEEPR